MNNLMLFCYKYKYFEYRRVFHSKGTNSTEFSFVPTIRILWFPLESKLTIISDYQYLGYQFKASIKSITKLISGEIKLF